MPDDDADLLFFADLDFEVFDVLVDLEAFPDDDFFLVEVLDDSSSDEEESSSLAAVRLGADFLAGLAGFFSSSSDDSSSLFAVRLGAGFLAGLRGDFSSSEELDTSLLSTFPLALPGLGAPDEGLLPPTVPPLFAWARLVAGVVVVRLRAGLFSCSSSDDSVSLALERLAETPEGRLAAPEGVVLLGAGAGDLLRSKEAEEDSSSLDEVLLDLGAGDLLRSSEADAEDDTDSRLAVFLGATFLSSLVVLTRSEGDGRGAALVAGRLGSGATEGLFFSPFSDELVSFSSASERLPGVRLLVIIPLPRTAERLATGLASPSSSEPELSFLLGDLETERLTGEASAERLPIRSSPSVDLRDGEVPLLPLKLLSSLGVFSSLDLELDLERTCEPPDPLGEFPCDPTDWVVSPSRSSSDLDREVDLLGLDWIAEGLEVDGLDLASRNDGPGADIFLVGSFYSRYQLGNVSIGF